MKLSLVPILKSGAYIHDQIVSQRLEGGKEPRYTRVEHIL